MAGIEAFERVAGKWVCLTKTPDNFFSSEGMGAVSFPLKIRLTSIMNEQLEATVDALKNDVLIKSDIQFSDTEVRGEKPHNRTIMMMASYVANSSVTICFNSNTSDCYLSSRVKRLPGLLSATNIKTRRTHM